jgi:hypothetical protein
MNPLIIECNSLLKKSVFQYAFCGGHALDIHLGYATRPHGDIDISADWEDRNSIITYMQTKGWTVYEALGEGKIHLIADINDQRLLKRNIFCVLPDCIFFHAEPMEDGIYHCDIDHVEQKKLDFVEFLFNTLTDGDFVYSRNSKIRQELDKAVLYKGDISYLAPEIVLLYKSTDLSREENKQDFDTMVPCLSKESREWLRDALAIAFNGEHEWIAKLEKIHDKI